MSRHPHVKSPIVRALLITGLILPAILPVSAFISAQGEMARFSEAHFIYPSEFGVTNPQGMAFFPDENSFIVWSAGQGANAITLHEEGRGKITLPQQPVNPLSAAFDNKSKSLFFLGAGNTQLSKLSAKQAGLPNQVNTSVTGFDIRSFDVQDAQGVTFDPGTGRLFILDARRPQVLMVSPDPSKGFDGASAAATKRIGRIDIRSISRAALRGIAFNPNNGHLYVGSPTEKRIYEITQAGDWVTTYDVSSLPLANVSTMLFAPSRDTTDDPNIMDLYVLDGGVSAAETSATGTTQKLTAQQSGQIAELSMQAEGILPPDVEVLPSRLVNTIDTSIWNHPSTDPAGIVYWPLTGKLLVSDTEIEESPQPFWDGYNIFHSTLAGSLSGNCTTFTSAPPNITAYNDFSDEPSGVTVNNGNDHLFFSDDVAKRIFEVTRGTDNAYCTSDDIVTSLLVNGTISDPEDIAYGNNKLFIASGMDAEVYKFDLGADEVLGGGDDGSMTHFDTASLGFNDLEGIGYNADDGTLLLVSTSDSDSFIGIANTSGTLLRAYDISYLGFVRRSAITIGPSSYNPAVDSIYIASRGIDNFVDPDNNDGKIWEIDISGIDLPDLIFKDGFESGNTSAWTSSVTNGGNLTVNSAAALVGTKGMSVTLTSDNGTGMEVTSEHPGLEKRYRARFYFDPNSISMALGDTHTILQGYVHNPTTDTHTVILQMQFRYTTIASVNVYQVRGRILDDSSAGTPTIWRTITDDPHYIEFDWSAASATGANDGYLTFWVDDIQVDNKTGIDNDTRRMDRVRLGPMAVSELDPGTLGTYYFDAFESRRLTYIGAEPVIPTATPSPTNTPTATPTPTNTPTATPTPISSSAHVNVQIGGVPQGEYDVPVQSSVRQSYAGLDAGPVEIESTLPMVASERVAYSPDGGTTWTSYSELMGLPVNQLTSSYTFPWYNNNDLNSQLRFGNVGDVNTQVKVFIGGELKGTYTLIPNQSKRVSYVGLDEGPVVIQSSGNVPIIASMRVAYFDGSAWTSYSEMMGLPSNKLTNSYTFPWYNNNDLNSQLRFGNVGTANTYVKVFIGGELQGTYLVLPNQSKRISYSGLDKGPVKITSSGNVPIIASMRVAYFDGTAWTDFSEMMGLPTSSLSSQYSFPVYDNVLHNSQLRFGNVGTVNTNVKVYINGVLKGTYTLTPNQSKRVSYPSLDSGPVVIQSSGNVPIIASKRVAYFNGTAWTSFAEMMGLPQSQWSTTFLFPWYNNLDLNTQLFFGVP